jgi:hypothetical protein
MESNLRALGLELGFLHLEVDDESEGVHLFSGNSKG